MKKCFLLIFLLTSISAQATSPLILEMLKPKNPQRILHEAPDVASMLLNGFSACNPAEALQEQVFVGRGVKYLPEGVTPKLTYPELLPDPSMLRVLTNQQDTIVQGAYLSYSAGYVLTRPVLIDQMVAIIAIKTIANVAPPRAMFVVGYRFNVDVTQVTRHLDAQYGMGIAQRLVPKLPLSAGTNEVWFKVDRKENTIFCFRYPSTVVVHGRDFR